MGSQAVVVISLFPCLSFAFSRSFPVHIKKVAVRLSPDWPSSAIHVLQQLNCESALSQSHATAGLELVSAFQSFNRWTKLGCLSACLSPVYLRATVTSFSFLIFRDLDLCTILVSHSVFFCLQPFLLVCLLHLHCLQRWKLCMRFDALGRAIWRWPAAASLKLPFCLADLAVQKTRMHSSFISVVKLFFNLEDWASA